MKQNLLPNHDGTHFALTNLQTLQPMGFNKIPEHSKFFNWNYDFIMIRKKCYNQNHLYTFTFVNSAGVKVHYIIISIYCYNWKMQEIQEWNLKIENSKIFPIINLIAMKWMVLEMSLNDFFNDPQDMWRLYLTSLVISWPVYGTDNPERILLAEW